MQSSIPTTNLAHRASFFWDGIARAALPLAEHPDVFTGGTQPFHRAMPAVVSGEPVPPPFVELCVRHWNTERDTMLAEETRRVFVPQVVKIEMTDAVFEEFRKPIHIKYSNWKGENIRVYFANRRNNEIVLSYHYVVVYSAVRK